VPTPKHETWALFTDAMNVLDVVDTKEMHQYATQDHNGRVFPRTGRHGV
jgi:hypothetical protein